MMATPPCEPKLVNDPVHGMVALPAWVQPVIATPLFQRLGRISQLGSLQKVWPAATHTRLEHSLGTFHLSQCWADKLRLCDNAKRALGLASLLHDIAHGPFSHTFEAAIQGTPAQAWYGDHDKFRYRLLQDPQLAAALGNAAHDVQCVWQGISQHNMQTAPCACRTCKVAGDESCEYQGRCSNITYIGMGALDAHDETDLVTFQLMTVPNFALLHAMLAGVVGVDRMDYLLRDSYHLTPQRRLDATCVQAIMEHSFIHNGQLAFTHKGARYIANLLEERAYLYREVYCHRRCSAADALLHQAFRMADLRAAPELQSEACFEQLDDAWVVSRAWQGDGTNPECAAHWLQRYIRGQVPEKVLGAAANSQKPLVTTRLERQRVTAAECANMVCLAANSDGHDVLVQPLFDVLQNLVPLDAVLLEQTFCL